MDKPESQISTHINFEPSDESDCRLVVIFSVSDQNIMRSDTDISYDEAEDFIKDLENELRKIQSSKQV